MPRFELVVFLWLPAKLRLERLRARELERYGEARLGAGGTMHDQYREFMEWAAAYDQGGLEMRSRARHEEWLAALPCAVARIEGASTVEHSLARVLDAWDS